MSDPNVARYVDGCAVEWHKCVSCGGAMCGSMHLFPLCPRCEQRQNTLRKSKSLEEPTEEQKQAAKAFCAAHMWGVVHAYTYEALARLLAEREAKLRSELDGERSLSEQLFSTNAKLQAEVEEE